MQTPARQSSSALCAGLPSLAALALLAALLAQAPPPPTPMSLITDQLASDNPADFPKALRGIEELLASDPLTASNYLRSAWLQKISDANRPADLERIATLTILAVPQDTLTVEVALRLRVRARWALKRPADALADAHTLYDFSSMGNTEAACLLLAEALTRAHPDDRRIVNRFMEEQLPPPAPVTAPPPTPAALPLPTVLTSIIVDTRPYEDALAKLTEAAGPNPVNNADQWAKGNLLLLAGRPAEALLVFQRLTNIVDYNELTAAHDAVARALKARDGNITAANAYVQDLKANNPRPR